MKRMICAQVLVIAVILVPFFRQTAEGARKALIVGVEEYAASEHNLKGGKEDIHLLKALLVHKGIFAKAEIKTLVDKEATRANIIKGFKEWLIQGTRPGDTALFFFSGHGVVQIWDENGDESIVIGEDGLSIKVQEPLGKEVIFAFLASHLWSLESFDSTK